MEDWLSVSGPLLVLVPGTCTACRMPVEPNANTIGNRIDGACSGTSTCSLLVVYLRRKKNTSQVTTVGGLCCVAIRDGDHHIKHGRPKYSQFCCAHVHIYHMHMHMCSTHSALSRTMRMYAYTADCRPAVVRIGRNG